MDSCLGVSLSCTDCTISGQDDKSFCSMYNEEQKRGTLSVDIL